MYAPSRFNGQQDGGDGRRKRRDRIREEVNEKVKKTANKGIKLLERKGMSRTLKKTNQ
jgi:hypothetical protein